MEAADLDPYTDAVALFQAWLTVDHAGWDAIVTAQPGRDCSALLNAFCRWFAAVVTGTGGDPLKLAQAQLEAFREAS